MKEASQIIGSLEVLKKLERELGHDLEPAIYDKIVGLNDPDLKIIGNTALADTNNDEDYDEWWTCDGCMKPIKPGKTRFDCKTCSNFTFCKSCFRDNDNHPHEFKKEKVPSGNNIPKNAQELISQVY